MLICPQDTHIHQDGCTQLSDWDLIDDRDGVHYMSILGQLARDGRLPTMRNPAPTGTGNRLEKDSGEIRSSTLQTMRSADKEYLQQRGAFTLPSKTCWYEYRSC